MMNDTQRDIFSQFLGMILLKVEIPEYMLLYLDHIKGNLPSNGAMALDMYKNAPNQKDEVLRSMILQLF